MSAKYRRRPLVFEAEQWFPDRQILGVETRCDTHAYIDQGVAHIHTLEGPMIVSSGDWIITGSHGEKYPCKPDVFAATYEKVNGYWIDAGR